MPDEIIISKGNCFICGEILDSELISSLATTLTSEKPIYKFVESFTRKRFDFADISKGSICITCFDELSEYDKICKRAANIQEHIAEVFNNTQMNFHGNKEPLKCFTCFAPFTTQDEMDDHECIIDAEEVECVEYVYDELDEDYVEATKEVKKSQKKTSSSTSDKPLVYSCDKCEKTFEKKKAYSKHIKLAHLPDGAEVFACSFCGNAEENIFVSELEFKLHNVIKHPEDKTAPLKCPGCPKVFNNKALLTRHFGLHSQDKPLVCDICGKRYFHTSSFHMHLIAHKGIKGHICTECGKSFISSSHLNRHLKTHTGVKNYECHECGSKFALRYNLRAHLNTHYGISRKRKSKPSTIKTDYT